jgi:hypothetical protein
MNCNFIGDKKMKMKWLAVATLGFALAFPAMAQKTEMNIIYRQPLNGGGELLTLTRADGSIVDVYCDGVAASSVSIFGRVGYTRPCRVPVGNTVSVTFKGRNAKLFWFDGKKQSETYTITAIYQ